MKKKRVSMFDDRRKAKKKFDESDFT